MSFDIFMNLKSLSYTKTLLSPTAGTNTLSPPIDQNQNEELLEPSVYFHLKEYLSFIFHFFQI